jgi:hypothetical protein
LLKQGIERKEIVRKGASKRSVNELGQRFEYFQKFILPMEVMMRDMSYRQFSRMCGKEVKKSKTNFKAFAHPSVKRSKEVDYSD